MNALPSERAKTRSANSRSGTAPRTPASSARKSPDSKRAQVDPLDPTGAADPGQPGAQSLAALGLLVAKGGDDERALVAQVADDEGEEVEGRGVGPVHVLDDPHDWLAVGQTAQQSEQQLEQPALGQRPVRGGTGRS